MIQSTGEENKETPRLFPSRFSHRSAEKVFSTMTTPPANDYPRLKLSVNVCTLLSSIFALLISLMIIGYVAINYLGKKNFKKSQNVSLLLTCNTCMAVICSSGTQILMTVSTMAGDWNVRWLMRLLLSACYLRGYFHFVFINAIYLSYVLQAGFRLSRIAFHEYKCLRKISSFAYFILVQWLISFLLILPILVGHEGYSSLIVHLPDEYYCQVPMTSVRAIVFSILSVYFLPACCLGMIYLWIIVYIRRRSENIVMIMTSVLRRNRRDAIILRRICLVMIVLLSLGIPSSIFVILYIITGHLHWASYRVGWMTIAMSFALISLSSLYVTPQIYKPIRQMLDTTTIDHPARQIRAESLLLKPNPTASPSITSKLVSAE